MKVYIVWLAFAALLLPAIGCDLNTYHNKLHPSVIRPHDEDYPSGPLIIGCCTAKHD